jgi:hypothetical protein
MTRSSKYLWPIDKQVGQAYETGEQALNWNQNETNTAQELFAQVLCAP